MVQNNRYICKVTYAFIVSMERYTLITITKKPLYFAQGNCKTSSASKKEIFKEKSLDKSSNVNAIILLFHCITYPSQLLFSADTAFIPCSHLYQQTPK